ncbi:MAG: hypothetical protein PWQ45_119 [Thermosipho sp. (in: thermotogales)]|jgi:5-methylcytosine-specific restriction endonuclease McrA|nr:hypothetical protein [Thermosipho sp. (in: thermotogales)]
MKNIPNVLRNYIKKRDSVVINGTVIRWKCRLCNRDAEHIHHIIGRNYIAPKWGIPDIQGGNHEYNMISLCSKCHHEIHQHGLSEEMKFKLIENNKSKTKKSERMRFFYNMNKGKLYKGELY